MKKVVMIFFFMFTLADTKSQSLMTAGEIYDYNIGDIFIRKAGGFSAPPVYTWDTITNKYFSAAFDTVFYVGNTYTYQPPACQTCSSYTSSSIGSVFYYTNLTDTIGTGLGTKPANIMCIDTNGYTGTWLDTIYYNSNYCNVLTTRTWVMGNGPVLFDTCWWYFEPFWGYSEFARGLGYINFYWNTCSIGFPNCETGFTLLYYKKGIVSCGTPPIISGLFDVIGTQNALNIFPNPATNEIRIESAEFRIKETEIYDVLGEKVFSEQQTSNNKQTINVATLSRGIYFVKVRGEKDERVAKFVKQ